MASPFGQPSSPSQSFGQPAAPSQPYGGYPSGPYQSGAYPQQYGYAAGPSTPLQTQPQPGQWAPSPYTQPGMGMAGTPPQPKKSRRGLWIGLSVALAILLVLGGGVGVVIAQYAAPTAAAISFCTVQKAQNYVSAYSSLSASMRAQFTQDQFETVSKQLDTIEGPVTACAAVTGGSALQYSLGSSTASLAVVVTRAKGSLQGRIHLKNESGWKVDSLDTSLVGVNLSALSVAATYCQDLQAQKYSDAYGLLSTSAQATVKSADYVQQSQLHDQIDGNVTSCTLAGLGSGNSDTAATITVSVARGKLGNEQGTVTLAVDGATWKVAQVAPNVQGSDLGPLLTGNAFCAALAKSDYKTAYGLLSANQQSLGSEATFAADMSLGSTLAYNGCLPDYSTYKVTGSSASYTAGLSIKDIGTGQTVSIDIKFSLVKENGAWKVEDFQIA
jgi:hypothetical protein